MGGHRRGASSQAPLDGLDANEWRIAGAHVLPLTSGFLGVYGFVVDIAVVASGKALRLSARRPDQPLAFQLKFF